MLNWVVPTLLYFAAKKIADICDGRVDSFFHRLPLEVTEEIVAEMSAFDLCDFIKMEGGIANIKKKFSTNGFQRFFLRFVLTMDSSTVHYDTRNQMIRHMVTFQDEYNQNIDYDEDMFCEKNYFHVHKSNDWCLQSLGLLYKFSPPAAEQVPIEIEFYRSKFWKKAMTKRLPIPIIPPEWNLPKNVNTDVLYYPVTNLVREKLVEENCLRIQFFNRLVGMTESFSRDRYHETLAYGFDLLAQTHFLEYPHIYKYYLYIYGMLAVTLAQMNIEFKWCLAFIKKAQQFMVYHSQRLDIFLYEQMMYSHFNAYNSANKAFVQLFTDLPTNSLFYVSSFNTRLKYFEFRIETNLLKILCYKNATIQTQEMRDLQARLIKLVDYYITKEKQFIHQCLGIKQNVPLAIEVGLAICEVYKLCLDILKNGYRVPSNDKLLHLGHQLGKSSNFRHLFFYHIAQPDIYGISHFHIRMNKMEETVQESTHFKNHEQFGECCFSYFILFYIIGNDQRRALDYLEQSHTIFKKCNSKYEDLCVQFKNKTANFSMKELNPEIIACDVKQLIKQVPKVGQYCKLGVISLQQADNRK